MNWLFPGFLAGGLMIGLPILLHLLRNKPKRIVPFPTLRFLAESAIRDTRKHRLRRWITLALRMLVIGLLAAAFARPFLKSEMAAQHTVMVIAIDNSMSMQARGRWEPLRAWALAQLQTLQPGDRAGLLLMNPEPSWLAPMTNNLDGLRSVMERLKPGYETTRYPGALRMAGETLASSPESAKTLVWMADEQRLGWLGASFDQQLPPGVKILFPELPPPVNHQSAITSLTWSPNEAKPAIEAHVRLYVPDSESRRITVRVAGKDGVVVARQDVALQRAAENHIHLPLDIPAGTQPDGFRVSLESLSPADADDLTADDSAWIAAAAQHGGMQVIFEPAKSGADYVAHALESTRKLAQNALDPAPLPANDWPPGDVAIVRDGEVFAAEQQALMDRFVTAGGMLWIFADGSEGQGKWLAAHGIRVTARERLPDDEEPWHLRDWVPEHALLAPFAGEGLLPLMEIEFYKGFAIEGDNVTPIAKWPDGATAIAEWNSGGRRMLLCGFAPDRDATDWMVRPSFVPFVHQAVRWLSTSPGGGADLRVGDTIAAPVSNGEWSVVDSPQGAAPDDAFPQSAKTAGNLRPEVPGLFEYAAAGKHHYYAVNVPPEESDLTPWPDQARLASLQSTEAVADTPSKPRAVLDLGDTAAESQQRVWWWLLAICCAAMLAELAISNRTAT